ncbi:hypothetical protein CPC08DRAFT_771740 [Agrocybe pediades]|nr:hypothetical protein CPC08DRAFT_771740 [Agrocybe pediades]
MAFSIDGPLPIARAWERIRPLCQYYVQTDHRTRRLQPSQVRVLDKAFAFFQQHVAVLGGNEESDAAYGVRLWARLLVNLVPLADGPLHSKWDAVLGAWSPFSFETCQLYPVEEASFREAVTMSDFPLTLSGPYAKEEDLPPPSLASPLAPDTTGPPVLAPSVQAVAPVPAPAVAVVPEQVTRANTPLVPLSPAVLPFTPTAPAIATLAQPDSTIISPGSSRRPSVGSQSTPLFLAPPGSYVGELPASLSATVLLPACEGPPSSGSRGGRP